jgi:hypothetical protein
MQDFFHIPDNFNGDVKIFTLTDDGNLLQWQLWEKPHGCSNVFMIAIGAGGGGGGGCSGASGTARGGGGGGGSGAISKLMVSSFCVPDRLFIQVGKGGIGSTAGFSGGAGARSWISVSPGSSLVLANMFLGSGGNNANGGGGGTTSAAGSAGSGSTAATSAIILSNLGLFSSIAGVSGGTGGNPANGSGTGVLALSSLILTGGAGGGGTTTLDVLQGGNISANGIINLIPGASAIGDNRGGNGTQLLAGIYPYACTGGSGGAPRNATVGGNGGDGAIGCGGGGGGAGTTGGNGGRGGDGLVIIISW